MNGLVAIEHHQTSRRLRLLGERPGLRDLRDLCDGQLRRGVELEGEYPRRRHERAPVAGAAGGSVDTVARFVAEGLQEKWG